MWIIYSLLTAFSLATSDALTKKALGSRDVYFVAWARLVYAMPLMVLCLFFIEIPPLDRTFWFAMLCALPLEIAAMILYTKALKISPLGLTIPFLAFTPLFLIFMSYLILGEEVSLQGGIGILFMALGSYTLNIDKIRENFMGPVRAVFREKGSVMMIVVAFIFSINSSLGKMAIEHSSPVFFGSLYFLCILIIFTPIALKKSEVSLSLIKKDIAVLFPVGFTYSMMIIFHMTALGLTNVAYMISVKRTSLLFSIIYAYFLFREERLAEKTAGTIIILVGFMLIVLAE